MRNSRPKWPYLPGLVSLLKLNKTKARVEEINTVSYQKSLSSILKRLKMVLMTGIEISVPSP